MQKYMEEREEIQGEMVKATTGEEAEELKNKKQEAAEPVIDSSSEIPFGLRRRHRSEKKVSINDQNSPTKAFKIASSVSGVENISLGKENELEVIGGGIDAALLTTSPRKICNAELISVGPVFEREKDEKQDDNKDHKIEGEATVLHTVSLVSVGPVFEREKDEKQDDNEDHKIEEEETVLPPISLVSVVPVFEREKDEKQDDNKDHKIEEEETVLPPISLVSVVPVFEREKNEKQDDSKDHKIEEEATVLPPVSSSVAHRTVHESSVDTLSTKQVDGAMKIEMATKANSYSDLGLGNGESFWASETAEWTLLIVSLLLEGASAVFDQLGYVLTSMVMAFVALLLSIVEFIRKARKESIIFDGRSLLPCFYRHSTRNFSKAKPFGSFVEYFGLLSAVWLCFYSTMQYKYTRQNLNNPIKMCLLPFIFVLCLFISKLIKSVPRRLVDR